MLLPPLHICFFGIKSLLFKKKNIWVLRLYSERMIYVPKIKEKLLGYVSDAFSRFSSFSFRSGNIIHKRKENYVDGANLEWTFTLQASCQRGLYTTHMLTGPGCLWQASMQHRSGIRRFFLQGLGFCICWSIFSLFSLSFCLDAFAIS